MFIAQRSVRSKPPQESHPKKECPMKRMVSIAAISAFMLVPVTASYAQNSGTSTKTTNGPSQTGQPNQQCGSPTASETPGNSIAANGSPFNPSGNAGTHYAGQQPQNSNNTASVAQYDVACSHQR
jgi:hypothetical protein